MRPLLLVGHDEPGEGVSAALAGLEGGQGAELAHAEIARPGRVLQEVGVEHRRALCGRQDGVPQALHLGGSRACCT